MKIVVVGGTGLIGSQVVSLLGKAGHEAVAASPSTGVDALTGEGVGRALAGADAVVDVSNSPSFEDGAALDFFTRSTENLTAAGREAGVGHHVVLSIVGVDRVPGLGYYRAKVAQEEILAQSGLPYSVVRATQFFEFVDSIMALTADGDTVRLPSTLMRPIASADVAAEVARTAQGEPLNGRRDIAGPEVFRLDRLGEITLAARADGRTVTTDEGAGMFAGIPDGVVSGDGSVPTATARYEDWLRGS
ncbi:SDR family oxidoreductase [Nocardiopsis sp. RV163]|uniref:SDR family oxidoreductase n=1 Tax=Nocardiopsis sp. RV163 TaxID=1661388 RepID=UPI00064BEB44|nr:NAD(P)H-binding protein [Nocardiopsis sp. RV163]